MVRADVMKAMWLTIAAMILVSCAAGDTRQEKLVAYKAKCVEFGFSPGTEAMAQCVMSLDIEDERESAALLRTLLSSGSASESGSAPQCTTVYTTSQGYQVQCY